MMNQQNQNPTQKPSQPNKGQSGQQTQQTTRPEQGGYSSPGQGNKTGQSAPADKK
jgi:hypothetical protein